MDKEKDNENELEKQQREEEERKKAKAAKTKYIAIIAASIIAVVGLIWALKGSGAQVDMQAAAAPDIMRQKKKAKTARDFEVKFLDSLDIQKHVKKPRRRMAGMGAPQASNRLNAAYRLGMAFASVDGGDSQERERLIDMVVPAAGRRNGSDSLDQYFYECVSNAEEDNERGIAAIMMSGYYFGSLCTVLEYVNEETSLPDERTLAKGIKKMENLKEYLNEALKAEREVKTTMAIQRLEAAADSVQSSYYNCQADYGEAGGKYDPLLSTIWGIDDILK